MDGFITVLLLRPQTQGFWSCLFGKVTEPAHAHADGAPSIVSFKVGFGDLRIPYCDRTST
jgi:hypothetical protein